MSHPDNAHSAIFGLVQRPLVDVIEQARKTASQIPYWQPAGDYTVSRWSDDGSVHDIIAWHKYADRRTLPPVQEDPANFNQVSYSLYIDGRPGHVDEVSLLIRARPSAVSIEWIFMDNALKNLGAKWIIKTLDALLPPMRLDAAILCDLKDTSPTSKRVFSGEPLQALITARLTEKDVLPSPLLAMIKAERVDAEVWDAARDNGVNIRMTPKGFAVFLTVDL